MSTSTPVHNAFILSRSASVRARVVPWEGYQRAGLLSAEDVALVQTVSQRGSVDALLDPEGQTYADLYCRLLAKLSRNDTLQFVLVLLAEMIQDHDERVALLLKSTESPYPSLLKLLDSSDDFIRLLSTILVSSILTLDPSPPETVIPALLTHLSALIASPGPEGADARDVGVQSAEGVLRRQEVRRAVWAQEGRTLVQGLVDHMKENPDSQMAYQLGFCVWLLSFEKDVAGELDAKYGIIPILVELLKATIKEKVTRIIIASLRNLVVLAPSTTLPSLLIAKALPLVRSLASRKWSDNEIAEDLQFLQDELKTAFEGMTSWDEYVAELGTGKLAWTPAHTDEGFWRENAAKLPEPLKTASSSSPTTALHQLVTILLSSKDPVVLSIALSDLSAYLKNSTTGRAQLEREQGVKGRVMELIAHSEGEVKWRALEVTQRLISHASWT